MNRTAASWEVGCGRVLAAGLAMLAVGLPGCRANLTIDAATSIACDSQRDCPKSFSCHPTQHVCKKSDAPDETPPTASLAWAPLPGDRAIANGHDVLAIKGTTETGATVVSAVLLDQAGQQLADFSLDLSLVDADGQLDMVLQIDLSNLDLTDVSSVTLSVQLQDTVGNVTPAGSLKTTALPVDTEPPVAISINVLGPDIIRQQTVDVELVATGATQVCFFGDGVFGGDSCTYSAFVSPKQVALSDGNGLKVVQARFRDDAWNESEVVSDEVAVVVNGVASAPYIWPPAGQTALKNGDVVTVTGFADTGTTVVSARLIDAMSLATVMDPVTGLTLSSGTFGGSFTASGMSDGTNVALEVIVTTGTEDSLPEDSRSNGRPVDLSPPLAPVKADLRFTERNPDPNNPAKIAESNNVYDVEGLPGLVAEDLGIAVYSDAGLTSQLASQSATVASGFAKVSGMPYNAARTFYVAAIDEAGNKSATTVTLPVLGNLVFTYNDGVGIAVPTGHIDFSLDSSWLAATPTATVDGNSAYVNLSWPYAVQYYYPDGATEGYEVSVARYIGEPYDSGLAPGTLLTVAAKVTVDGTPPSVTPDPVTQAARNLCDALVTWNNMTATVQSNGTELADNVEELPGSLALCQGGCGACGVPISIDWHSSFGPITYGVYPMCIWLTDAAGNTLSQTCP